MSFPAYLRDEARRSALAPSALREQPLSPIGDGGGEALRSAPGDCLSALSLISEEVAKARELAAAAANDIERDAYLWQGDAARSQIEQAARVAEERLRLLDSLKSGEDFRRENERCAADTLYWFRMYAWGYDPRSPLKVQPFYSFPRQEDYISWLDETVLRRRKSGVVEKARDQRATVGALNWVCHEWLYVPGFSAFLSSATEDLVDSKRDPDTLFEKVRFHLRLTPSWMLPEGFDLRRDLTYMNLHNPRTGKHFVTPSPSEASFKLARAELNSYHYPAEELGKAVQAMRPEKRRGLDNFIDTLRGFATKWGPSVAPLTEEEEREAKLPEYLRAEEVLSHRGRPEYVELVLERESAVRRIALRERREREEHSEAWARALGRPVLHRRYRRRG